MALALADSLRGVVICLERGADLHMAQLMPLPLTVSWFSKIQVVLTFMVPADLDSPGKGPLNGCCVCVCVSVDNFTQNRTVGESPTLYPLFNFTSLK